NDAKGGQVGIHPVERKTFLDKEFVLRVVIENDFGDQAVDGHDCDLARDLDPVIDYFYVFARANLLGFVGKLGVVLQAPLGVLQVFLEAFLGIVGCGAIDFAIGINTAQTAGDFFGIGGFEQQAVQPNPRVTLRILFDEV